MSFDVLFQIFGGHKSFTTKCAHIRFNGIMDTDVFLQTPCQGERLTTYLTLERFHGLVFHRMFFQKAFQSKSFVTYFTLELSLARVIHKMVLEVVRVAEKFSTNSALMLDTIVNTYMCFQGVCTGEALITYFTFVNPLSMHLKIKKGIL